ncbi:MAG: hypothetical protein ACJAVV_002849 [Alphaproteobacteria bacterium]
MGACLLFILVAACGDESRKTTLAFSTELPAPAISEAVKKQLADEGFVIELAEAANPPDIFKSIQNRSIDLGVLEEPDHPITGVVTIAPLYPSVLHVLNNLKSDPSNFMQLVRGSKIYAGPPGGAADRLLIQLAIDFNIARDEYEVLDNPWMVNPEVFFIFGGLLTNESIEQLAGYRLFGFSSENDVPGGSVADAIVLKHHHLKRFLLPRGTYHSLSDKAITTLSIRTVMIAHEEFPADVAFDIATNLFNNAQEYSLDYPLVVRELDVRFNPVDLMLPLHEGSRQFLNRDKPGFIEKHVDIIALVFTFLVALGSGLFTLYRRHLQVKKDRVDTFYSKLLAVRSEAQTTTDHFELKVFKAQAVDVQQEVLQLLIDERVTADAGLVAFISLSNQIIDELDNRIKHEI